MIPLKLLFKNKTRYTKAVYSKFLAFHRKKYHFTYTIYTILVISFLLFSLIWQISYHNFSIALLLCGGLIGFILWRYLHPISEIAKEYKSDKIQKEKEFTFLFYEKFFTVDDKEEIYEIKYYQLHKVFETSDFFYLYLDKKHAFLIDKSNFENSTSSAFSAFIKKKCWHLYKKVK